MEKALMRIPSMLNVIIYNARAYPRHISTVASFNMCKKWDRNISHSINSSVICGTHREAVVPSISRYHAKVALRHKGSTSKKRKKTVKYDFDDREDLETLQEKYTIFRPKKTRIKQLYIVDRVVAKRIIEKIWPNGSLQKERSLILDCFPGVGLVTEELISAGAAKVAAVENDKLLLPFSEDLCKHYPDKVQSIYADVTRLDPLGEGEVKLPALTSQDFFKKIDVQPVPWESDPVLKVFQIIADRPNERALLLRNVYSLIGRYSWFHYGRIESILAVSEKHYQVLTQTPGRKHSRYQILSVLYNMCCDLQLLHVEKRTSFSPQLLKHIKEKSESVKTGDIAIPNVYVIRVTPKKDFFSHNLSQEDYDLLLFLTKQLLTSKNSKLMQTYEKWTPGYGSLLTKYGIDEKTRTCEVSGELYFKIFIDICQAGGFDGSWLRDEALDFIEKDNSYRTPFWITKSKFTF
ncbi:dimethyladenosine transferase 2, mitochondrial-like [Ptychodera flava]|uniref:dimethyladenosine transferase 2, mitochondrial-like n=1 Tax=Ptychodera flava TaxID=63121 RepID=UPI00396A0956